jgi:L-malate glycosyltransferase
MRILLLNYEFPPLGGGGGVFTRFLAEELAKEHDVDLITTRLGDLKKRETVRGVNIFRVPVMGKRSFQSAGLLSLISFPLSAAAQGLRLLKKKDYDVINTHFALPTGPAGCFLSKVSGKKNVLNVFGGDIYDPTKRASPHRNLFLRWAVRRILNHSSAIIAESEDIAGHVETIYHPNKKAVVIPIGFPARLRSSKEKEEVSPNKDKIHFISIGRMVKRKGFDVLIRALSLLKDIENTPNLYLIGDGPELNSLKTLSRELGMQDHIIFSGSVDDEEKFRLLSNSDIYVLSSVHEGFGIVLLEAMCCGLAVIATNNGGQTDIIKDGKNGILVPSQNAETLADAMRALALNSDKRKEMGEFNKEDVRKYGILSISRKYVDIFRTVRNEKSYNE